jgi:thiol-disulfide isomerase/thioredoxin
MNMYNSKLLLLFCALIFCAELHSQSGFTVTLQYKNSEITARDSSLAAGQKLLFVRKNRPPGVLTIDTFVMVYPGGYELKLNNVKSPGTGWVVHGADTLKQVFVAPGHNAKIVFAGSPGEMVLSGSGAPMQRAFDSLMPEVVGEYCQVYSSLGIAQRTLLLGERLKRIDTTLPATHRPLKDYFITFIISATIDLEESILALNDAELLFLPYYRAFGFPGFKTDVDLKYKSKLNQLISAQKGRPAPAFTLGDSTGRSYSLSDFKGKVVYFDLWASWCLPCRLESPYLQKLVNRYRNRTDIIFVGIAVSDQTKDWKKALRQDRPGWLQLHDKTTRVANAYAARSLPRYVLIDKAGNVAEFFAPAPSDHAKVISLIDTELSN